MKLQSPSCRKCIFCEIRNSYVYCTYTQYTERIEKPNAGICYAFELNNEKINRIAEMRRNIRKKKEVV